MWHREGKSEPGKKGNIVLQTETLRAEFISFTELPQSLILPGPVLWTGDIQQPAAGLAAGSDALASAGISQDESAIDLLNSAFPST